MGGGSSGGNLAERGTHSKLGNRKRICLSHPPTAGGADLQRAMGAQEATQLENRPSQPSPSFMKGGVGAEVEEGDQLARCAGQGTVARGQPAGDLTPSGEKLGTAHRDSVPGAHGVPFPLRLSRPLGVGSGFPLRASCAHCAFLRAGGAVGPAPRDQTYGSQSLGSGLRQGPGVFTKGPSGIDGVLPFLAVGVSPIPTLALPGITCHRHLFLRGARSPRFACQQ